MTELQVIGLEIRALGARMDAGFAQVDARFAQVDAKIIELRLDLVQRIDAVDRKAETVVDSLADFRREYHQHTHG